MAAIRAYQQALIEIAATKSLWLNPLGMTNGYPIWLVRTRLKRTHKDPKILVVSGWHGEEAAGPYAILQWLKDSDPKILKAIDVSFIPIINPEGFSKGTRYSSEGGPNNCGFCHSERELDPLKAEGVILKDHIDILRPMAKDGYLDLHEDKDEKAAYLYRYEDSEEPSPIVRAIKKTLSEHFKLCDGDQVEVDAGPGKKAKVENGIVHNHCDGSFDDWMWHLGVPRVIVSETPGRYRLAKRVEAGKAVIDKFIEVILKEESEE